MIAIRVPLAFVSGLFLSFAIFLGLWHLVGAQLDVGKPIDATIVEFTRQIADTPSEPKRALKPEREPPILEPRPGIKGPADITIADDFAFQRTAALPVERGKGLPLAGSDRDTLPLVRVPPEYPPGAVSRGLEGWVQVRFSVTPIGSVRDATVVASEPGTVFDAAALAAVARWRYNPRIDGGVAVERVGLQTVIRFELDR